MFTKHCGRIQKFRRKGDLNYICKNELDKACFAHDAGYSDNKDLAKRTISYKILKDRAYEIALNPKYDGYERGLASVVYKCFDKKTRSVTKANKVLAKNCTNQWLKNSKKMKVYTTTIHRIFETKSNFHVKQRTTGKVQFLFFSSFLLVLTKFLFWEEDWALGYNSMKFRDFPDIS